jgi:hypothetical protein
MADWKDALIAKTEDTTPDIDNDFGLSYDFSAAGLKKVLLKNWVGTALATLRSAFTPASSSGPASLSFHEDTDNGTNKISISAPSSIASDKTQSLQDASDTFIYRDTTDTLTNKRITARVGTTASSTTPTPDADAHDIYTVTALAAGATFGAPTGTPTGGQSLMIRIKDNGTARTLAFNAIYRAIGVTLPTTTVINKTVYLGMIYNATDSKWDVLGVGQEA